jgi:hypothetical protein
VTNSSERNRIQVGRIQDLKRAQIKQQYKKTIREKGTSDFECPFPA